MIQTTKEIILENTNMNTEEYKKLKSEVLLYFQKNKVNKGISVVVPSSSSLKIIEEYYFKVKHILEFIVVRGMNEILVAKCQNILAALEDTGVNNIFIKISTSSYSKPIHEYKLRKLLELYDESFRLIVSFMLNAQPMKERQFPQQTVGVSENEFNEILNEDVDEENIVEMPNEVVPV